MKYQDAIRKSMNRLARDPLRRFVGYSVTPPNSGIGAFADVPAGQLIETPSAENLMVGLAIGLAIEGFKPVVYFERFDFILNALDAIVNHLDKIRELSSGQYDPRVIFRVNVGASCQPLYTGPTHTQDFTQAMRLLVDFPIETPTCAAGVLAAYDKADKADTSFMVVEYRDDYE